MTDPKPCAEINASLALAKGYLRKQVPHQGLMWLSPSGRYSELPPDFCGDSALIGPLLEELVRKGYQIGHNDEDGYCIFLAHHAYISTTMQHAKRLAEAVARAAEAMIEGKK